jgi:hypothetical protein
VFGNKIKLDKALMERVKLHAAAAGYAGPEEFIVHAIEKELTRLEQEKDPGGNTDQAVLDRLKGLGYIE